MRKTAEPLGVVHTHTHTQVILVEQKIYRVKRLDVSKS